MNANRHKNERRRRFLLELLLNVSYNNTDMTNRKRGGTVGVSYKKLWHLLIDRDLKKGDLCKMSMVSGTSLAKMARGENVNTDTLVRICTALNCTLNDISEIVPDEKAQKPNGGQV